MEENLGEKVFDPVGRCIYCGRNDGLTDEHIVPYALNGRWVLPKSSCPVCTKITGKLEARILRGALRPVRVLREMRSRSRHATAPSSYPLTLVKGDREWEVRVPLSEYPVMVPFPRFAVPAHIDPRGYKRRIKLVGMYSYFAGADRHEFLARHDADDFKGTMQYQAEEFARMIAKIAWAFAVAIGHDELIDGDPYVPPIILGKDTEIGRYVGTFTDPLESHHRQLHRLKAWVDEERRLVLGNVQIFADWGTPQYGVVLGAARADARGLLRAQ